MDIRQTPANAVVAAVAPPVCAVAKKTATLTITPFDKLSRKVQKRLEEEGEKLVRFAEPEAGGYAVLFEG